MTKPVISIYELTFAVMRELIMGLYRELNNSTEVIRRAMNGNIVQRYVVVQHLAR